MSKNGNIYDWLDQVRKRPSMYFRDEEDKLATLEKMVFGYYAALFEHGIKETVPRLDRSHFAEWLGENAKISSALGWCYIINQMHPNPEEAFDKFFEYIEEYRNHSSNDFVSK
jgi:hypothetical protein